MFAIRFSLVLLLVQSSIAYQYYKHWKLPHDFLKVDKELADRRFALKQLESEAVELVGGIKRTSVLESNHMSYQKVYPSFWSTVFTAVKNG